MSDRHIFHEVKGPGHVQLMDRDEKLEREVVETMYPGSEWRYKVSQMPRHRITNLFNAYISELRLRNELNT